jgi:hypothetical protein
VDRHRPRSGRSSRTRHGGGHGSNAPISARRCCLRRADRGHRRHVPLDHGTCGRDGVPRGLGACAVRLRERQRRRRSAVGRWKPANAGCSGSSWATVTVRARKLRPGDRHRACSERVAGIRGHELRAERWERAGGIGHAGRRRVDPRRRSQHGRECLADTERATRGQRASYRPARGPERITARAGSGLASGQHTQRDAAGTRQEAWRDAAGTRQEAWRHASRTRQEARRATPGPGEEALSDPAPQGAACPTPPEH